MILTQKKGCKSMKGQKEIKDLVKKHKEQIFPIKISYFFVLSKT